MQSSKVGINIAIQSKSSGWRNTGTLVFRALQVLDDGLDCTGMTLLGVVIELGNLTDSVGGIRRFRNFGFFTCLLRVSYPLRRLSTRTLYGDLQNKCPRFLNDRMSARDSP